jgi:hypothetical protein
MQLQVAQVFRYGGKVPGQAPHRVPDRPVPGALESAMAMNIPWRYLGRAEAQGWQYVDACCPGRDACRIPNRRPNHVAGFVADALL